MIAPIEETTECLEIEGFFSFKHASISLSNVTALIGPQASGKSIIAKLIFFGRNYINRLLVSSASANFSLRTFKKIQLEEFRALFGGIDDFTPAFRISYKNSDIELEILRPENSTNIKFQNSKNLDALASKIKRSFVRIENSIAENRTARAPALYHFLEKEEKEFYQSVPESLFVPASRSFYATVSDELFTFLASSERVDRLTAQFGSYYEFSRRKVSGEFGRTSTGALKKLNKRIQPVIKGDFLRVRSRDYIRTDWGRVELRDASSGQQEALPLFFSLFDYPQKSRPAQMLIVEEPEAHLFPDAQKYILDSMVEESAENLCDMLFTTHSPYVIACMNNHIAKRSDTESFPSFGAFNVDHGTVSSIIDEDGFIDANFLDSISEKIAQEFLDNL